MNSLDTRFSKNVFEAVQKTRRTCFIGSKTTRLRLVVLNPIKHSCSFFKHYVTTRCVMHCDLNCVQHEWVLHKLKLKITCTKIHILLRASTVFFLFSFPASNGGSELFLSTNDKPDGKTKIVEVDGGFPSDQYEYDR